MPNLHKYENGTRGPLPRQVTSHQLSMRGYTLHRCKPLELKDGDYILTDGLFERINEATLMEPNDRRNVFPGMKHVEVTLTHGCYVSLSPRKTISVWRKEQGG